MTIKNRTGLQELKSRENTIKNLLGHKYVVDCLTSIAESKGNCVDYINISAFQNESELATQNGRTERGGPGSAICSRVCAGQFWRLACSRETLIGSLCPRDGGELPSLGIEQVQEALGAKRAMRGNAVKVTIGMKQDRFGPDGKGCQ